MIRRLLGLACVVEWPFRLPCPGSAVPILDRRFLHQSC
jgi:hypothetical protein